MFASDLAGINHKYRTLGKTTAKCLVCGEYSECQIKIYEKSYQVFFRKTNILDEQFLFDWKKCNHRAMLLEPQDILRYKREHVETGILSVPSQHNMNFHTMALPKVKNYQIVLVIIFSIILGVLLSILFDRIGIPFIP